MFSSSVSLCLTRFVTSRTVRSQERRDVVTRCNRFQRRQRCYWSSTRMTVIDSRRLLRRLMFWKFNECPRLHSLRRCLTCLNRVRLASITFSATSHCSTLLFFRTKSVPMDCVERKWRTKRFLFIAPVALYVIIVKNLV